MLETPRVRMESWQADDWLAFRRLATDPRVMQYITGGAPWSDEEIREFVGRQIGYQQKLGYCLWKLVWKETNELVGFCGLQPFSGTGEIEIGWWLAPELWGQGIATEAARAALRFAFEQAGMRRVVSVALPENGASIRIMEKIGMICEGRTLCAGREHVLYAVGSKPGPLHLNPKS